MKIDFRFTKYANIIRSNLSRGRRRVLAGVFVVFILLMPLLLYFNREVTWGEKAIAEQPVIKEGRSKLNRKFNLRTVSIISLSL